MLANIIKVSCLFLGVTEEKTNLFLAGSKLSLSRDKRKKMWTHKKTHEHCEDEICFPLGPIRPVFPSFRGRFSFRLSPRNERPDLATFTYLRRHNLCKEVE